MAPRAWTHWGRTWTYLMVVVAALGAVGALVLTVGGNSPAWTPAHEPMLSRARAAFALPATRELAAIYAITFGGFVAFGAYPPTFLHLSLPDVARLPAKKPLALLGALGTMAGIWWFALRPRLRKRP